MNLLRVPHNILSLFFAIFLFVSCQAHAGPRVMLFLDPGHGGRDQGGQDGKGFKNENGIRIPEDGYTYDVVKRIQRLAQKNGWETMLTIADQEDHPLDYDENRILPAKLHAVYPLSSPYVRVFPGKEGLTKRLNVLYARLAASATVIFISIHFDYAHPELSGTQIFTAAPLSRHPFILALAKKFNEAGYALQFKGKTRENIDSRNRLFVLKENPVIPRVLLELGNFNNPRDRACMLKSSGRERYAEIITRAIHEYILQAFAHE